MTFSVKMQVFDTVSQVLFKYFPSKKQLPGLSISGTLVENRLNSLFPEIIEDIFKTKTKYYNTLNALFKEVLL